jgi:hypothetical protein
MGRNNDRSKQNSTALRGQRGQRCTHTPVATSLCRGEESSVAECTGSNGQGIGASRSGWEDTSFISPQESQAVVSNTEVGSTASVCGNDGDREVYEGGGQRDRVEERFDLIPPTALLAVAKAMGEGGKKYGDWNWQGLPMENLLNHAMRHIVLYMEGDRDEDHLGHAAAGLLMAKDAEVRNEW